MISQEQYNTIKKLQQEGLTYKGISEETNLCVDTIYKYCRKPYKKQNVRTTRTKTIDEKVIELYKKYNAASKVGDILSISRKLILKIVKEYDESLIERNRTYSTNKPRKKYKLNENYFEKIDTPEKAYLLGYLYTDGYNAEKNRTVKLGLHKQDSHVLDFFKKEIGIEVKLEKCKGNVLRLNIHSKKLSTDLSKLGCFQKKTYTLEFPTEEQVPNKYMSHFIRGAFDGDGCMYIRKVREKAKTGYANFVGCKLFLNGINNYLHNVVGMTYRQITTINNNDVFGELRYMSIPDIVKLKDFIYKDSSFHLDRKYNKMELFLSDLGVQWTVKSEDVVEMYNKEQSLDKVAELLGISPMTVYNRIKKINPLVLRRKNLTEMQINQIHFLFKEGKRICEISKTLDIKQSTVEKQLKRIII